MKKFNIVRLGCPKNDADMDIFRGILEKNNYSYEEDAKKCDYIFIDTCGFIESAKEESINTILGYAELKKTNKNLKIIAIGCLIERYFENFKKELKEADGLFGVVPPQVIFDKINNGNMFFKLPEPMDVYECNERYIPNTSYAYVKIGDGCNRNCAFCSIPSFKGAPMSRSIEDIKKEVEFLVKNGKKEIILVSQDNTLYGINLYKKQALPDLLKELNSIEGEFWIRVMYLHPDFLTDEIIETIHNTPKVVKYFDVPMQHGSDKILNRMGRIKKTKDLFKMIEKIRKNPNAVLRTSIVVGFPGETNEDFEKLLNFVNKIEFDKLGGFAYSPEENTEAFTMDGQVDEKIKEKRLEELMMLQKDISEEIMIKHIGKNMKVLIEEKTDNVYVGRTFMDAPEIDGNIIFKCNKTLKIGNFINVKINNAYEYDLEGEVLDE
ncbi:ribosomal protein S12 methylthiotransferase RimO [Tepiditoga spiralis]|uniref:Ribosomal protein uS12 methylthiotransferase RimO n=1 Tax=Tepiditoga spiralis TaxID=2108365 RepID=A0A7G1G8S8_9BACT|nr:30S ribosomal protein S12 methylthiotransferase RimO [Tepiditoga spiralis]BBE30452.1 ribosomal protein S12 methylthiotransferase RimO [Tepiditoga spiralis]